MTRLVRLDFCCNDPDNGQFAGRIAGVQLPDMDLELAADDMVGPVFRLLPADRMRVGRRVFRWEWSKEWFGNWCWNAYYVEPAVAVELLASLHGSGRFHVECGEERLFAHWKDRRPFDAADREFLERRLIKGMIAEERSRSR